MITFTIETKDTPAFNAGGYITPSGKLRLADSLKRTEKGFKKTKTWAEPGEFCHNRNIYDSKPHE